MAVEVIGRDDDLSSLYARLDRRGGLSAIALEGEAGIGKSTLLRAVVDAAHGRGLRVLSSRPASRSRRSPTPAWVTCSKALSTTFCPL